MKPQELFAAHERGEKIEVNTGSGMGWGAWNGRHWDVLWKFRIVKPEPKLVPHWPALLKGYGDAICMSDILFPTLESAQKIYVGAVRLATEWPPIMLEVKE